MSECVGDDRTRVRRRGRPSKSSAADLTQRIVMIGARRFLADGFEMTSMDAIAMEAGISKRTLYARYGSKSLLLQAVADHLFNERASEFTVYRNSAKPTEDLLRDMAHHMNVRVLMPLSIDVYRLMVAQSQRHKKDSGLLLGGDRYLRSLLITLEIVFARAIQRGDASRHWNAELLAEQFLEAVCAWDLRRLVFGYELPADPEQRRRRVDQRVDLFLSGMRHLHTEAISDASAVSLAARSSR